MKKTTTLATGVPQQFLNRFGDKILGTLCGFDRLRLRGTLRHLFQPTVMEAYLNASGVLIKDFGAFRAHRIIRKIPKTHRYVLTPTGRLILTALRAAHCADVDRLTAMAA